MRVVGGLGAGRGVPGSGAVLGAVLQLGSGEVAERHPDAAAADHPAAERPTATSHAQPNTRTHDHSPAHDHHSPAGDVLCAADVRPTHHDELAADIGCRDD